MYGPYFLRILMQERDREILKALGRGSYHTYRRRRDSGVSKRIARRLLSTLVRLKAIARPYLKSNARQRHNRSSIGFLAAWGTCLPKVRSPQFKPKSDVVPTAENSSPPAP